MRAIHEEANSIMRKPTASGVCQAASATQHIYRDLGTQEAAQAAAHLHQQVGPSMLHSAASASLRSSFDDDTCTTVAHGQEGSRNEHQYSNLNSRTSCKGLDLSSKRQQAAYLGRQVGLCDAQGILPPSGCPVHGKCSLRLLGAHKQGLCCGPVLLGGRQVALHNVQRQDETRAGPLQVDRDQDTQRGMSVAAWCRPQSA